MKQSERFVCPPPGEDKRKEQMEKLYVELVALGIKHPRVEWAHPPGFQHEGWYCVEFGRSEWRFLGRDFADAMRLIELVRDVSGG